MAERATRNLRLLVLLGAFLAVLVLVNALLPRSNVSSPDFGTKQGAKQPRPEQRKSASLDSQGGGFQLKDEVAKFTARFPAEPTLDKVHGSSDLGPHVHYTWEVDIDDRHWSVTYTEYVNPPVKNYDKNVMSLKAATKGKLVSHARIELGGFDGREVVILLPNNTAMRQLMFMVGNRLYQVVYGGPAGSETHADAESFLKSFELLAK